MADDLPDWLNERGPLLEAGRVQGGRVRDRHLSVLRDLLKADYLHRADWGFALRDVARMAEEGLNASSAMVAVFDAAAGRWSARTSDGQTLDDDTISQRGSTAVLEAVRKSGRPLLTSGAQPFEVHSMSVMSQGIESVLAVPMRWWSFAGDGSQAAFGGCLYAHRTGDQPPFTEGDVELVQDIARIVEPTLNVLRQLASLEVELRAQRDKLAELESVTTQEYRLGNLRSQDVRFGREVLGTLRQIALADRVGLLILGPSGAGKSFLAKSYHFECPRGRGPFVTLDCSQITSAITLGAELFGYASNSGYANAPPRGRPGKAKLADGGTLFLDEIGCVPSELQQKLLRLIQEGAFAPLGGSEEERVDVQILAATNEPLEALVETGAFREDLYWRVCEITVELPPLDARIADIPHLARSFLESARARFKRPHVEGYTEGAMAALVRHPWSRFGNIRGLEHVITRAVLLAPSEATRIGVDELQFDALGRTRLVRPPGLSRTEGAAPASPGSGDPDDLRQLLEQKIGEHGGRIEDLSADAELSERAGRGGSRIPTSTLYAWIRKWDLKAALKAHRSRRRDARYEEVVAAIQKHGSGSEAARALGISRDALVWQLRKAGMTVADVLDGRG